MKKLLIVAVIIIVIAGVLYAGRHKITSLMGGFYSPNTPPSTAVATPTSSATVSAASVVMTKTNTAKGDYLTDPKGMTIYIFDKDQSGVSNCSGNCATVWPPYIVGAQTALPANVTIIKRADGSMQYAYKGMPLYYYQKDAQAGDVMGDGVNGTWHLVKP
ncbi:MAG TPA: hypothetical protein VLF68_00160 [Candidatus Saccharimonadales bacterium]|nr:hypothetical protein [Candidatus Saccharimonadales bacterium]